jgi:hypothetical protein
VKLWRLLDIFTSRNSGDKWERPVYGFQQLFRQPRLHVSLRHFDSAIGVRFVYYEPLSLMQQPIYSHSLPATTFWLLLTILVFPANLRANKTLPISIPISIFIERSREIVFHWHSLFNDKFPTVTRRQIVLRKLKFKWASKNARRAIWKLWTFREGKASRPLHQKPIDPWEEDEDWGKINFSLPHTELRVSLHFIFNYKTERTWKMLLRQIMRRAPSMASIYHVLIFCNHKPIFNFQPISLAIDLIASAAK